MKKFLLPIGVFTLLLCFLSTTHAQFVGPAPLVVPGDNYAFAYSPNGTIGSLSSFGLYFNETSTTTPGYEFKGSGGSKLVTVQSIVKGNREPGDITFGTTGSLIINPNRYAFRFSLTNSYGLFFNAAGFAYEFRTADASPVLSIGANSGDLTATGTIRTPGSVYLGPDSAIFNSIPLNSARIDIRDETGTNSDIQQVVANLGWPAISWAKQEGSLNTPLPVTGSQVLGSLNGYGYNPSGYGLAASINFFTDDSVAAGSTSGRMNFRTTAIGDGSPSTRMTIREDGKIGIGTSNPTAALQVGDSSLGIKKSYIKVSSSGINVPFPSDSITRRSGIQLRHFDNQNWGMTIESIENRINDNRSGLSIRSHQGDSTGVERMYIDRVNGNVGVGTATPDGRVHAHQSEGLIAGHFTGDVLSSAVNVVRAEYTADSVFVDAIAVSAESTPINYYGIGIESRGGWYGVRGIAHDDGSSFAATRGVYGQAGGLSDPGAFSSHYGVRGQASSFGADTTVTNYGVFGEAFGSGTNYAGYFGGDVTVTGTFSNPSDANLKQNVESIEDAAEALSSLQAHQYEFDQEKYGFMHLPEGTQYGLIAQEVEKVLPELVKKNVHAASDPKNEDRPQHDRVEYKSVNYMGLIPLMVQAINEQSEVITEKDEEVAALNDKLASQDQKIADLEEKFKSFEHALSSCCTGQKSAQSPTHQFTNSPNDSWLGQNIPNPFDRSTIIQYYVPESVSQSQIIVYDQHGKEIKSFNLEQGYGEVKFNESDLSSGTYIYTLINDGNVVSTKKMVLK